jgi:hypothetical protein
MGTNLSGYRGALLLLSDGPRSPGSDEEGPLIAVSEANNGSAGRMIESFEGDPSIFRRGHSPLNVSTCILSALIVGSFF